MELNKQILLEKIPPDWMNLIDFVKKISEDCYYNNAEKHETLLIDEVDYDSRQYLIEIDVKHKKVSFTDDLVVLDSVANYIDYPDYPDWNKAYSRLKEAIKNNGFSLINSGNGNDDYLWYRIEIDVHNFNEGKLREASKLWSEYNKNRRSLYKN